MTDKVWKEDELSTYISTARMMIRDDARAFRDEGTCVLGAGIAIYAIPSRGRKPRQIVLTDQPFQGNVGSYNASRRALEWLKDQGLPVYWYDGFLD